MIFVMLGVLIVAVWFLFVGVPRLKESGKKHDKCAHCKAKLKADGTHYAYTCSKCGKDQPWKPETKVA